jgi:DNA-binding NarL/FixJ family response regulator
MNKIRIAIVDDHKIFRQGVKSVLQPVKEFEVVLEVNNGQDLLNQFSEVLPDVVLMDIKMAGMDGIATTRLLMQTHVQAKVIGLSVFDQEIYISSMFEAGAKGYLLKDAEPEEIVYAINKVHEGDYHFKGRLSNILYEKLFHQLNKTTSRLLLPLVALAPAEGGYT